MSLLTSTMSTPTVATGKRPPPPQLMFDDGSRVMAEEAVEPAAVTPLDTPASIRGSISLDVYYEVDRISEEISRKFIKNDQTEDGMLHVALQFPDELLDDSPEVCWLFEEYLGEKIPSSVTPFVFCLGDTTVGSCCPDEVAALHLQADVMVHYGHACLSPTGTLPVIYSFGRLEMDVSAAVKCICKDENIVPEKFLVLYQVGYQHAMEDLRLALIGVGSKEVVVGQIPQPTSGTPRIGAKVNSCCGRNDTPDNACCDGLNESGKKSLAETTNGSHEETHRSEHRPLLVGGLELADTIESWDQLVDYTVLFIGESESTSKRQYVNAMLRFLSLTTPPQASWTYSPKAKMLSTSIPIALQKQLNRRFFLTQKARDANVLGVLVSNLSQQYLVDVVKALKARIHDAGKTSYSFAVGKINPAKLANFAEIECFVLVACREHSLLNEEREYPVPVITPLELDVALGNLEWGSQAYSLDCQDVLHGVLQDSNAISSENNDDDDAPYFSLVTGKYVQKPITLTQGVLDLEQLPGKGQVTAYKSEAANFLKQREYQGLYTLAGQTEAKGAVLGQRGIASDYGGS